MQEFVPCLKDHMLTYLQNHEYDGNDHVQCSRSPNEYEDWVASYVMMYIFSNIKEAKVQRFMV